MKKLYQSINNYVPLVCIIVFLFTIFSAIVYIFCAIFEKFADFINLFSAPIRATLSFISSIVPFSLAEVFIILLPIWAILLIFLAVKFSKDKRGVIRFLSILCSFFCLYFVSFVWTYASGYHTTPIEEKMELDRENITKQEIYEATIILTEELNNLAEEITYNENGSSKMPYSYKEMSQKICDAYGKFSKETDIVQSFKSRIKPLFLSEPMTYTHLSGIYICLTGEANVNTNYPNYIVASTAAHEMAHQRGVAREDEASFIAFLALSYSDDSFLKYSAYLDVYIDLLLDLRKQDKELYTKAREQIDQRVIDDYNSFVDAFQKYSDSFASDVSDTINNAYLQANGDKDGTDSYKKVSELVCAYLVTKQ